MKKNNLNNQRWMIKRINKSIWSHFKKIEWCDAVVVVNQDRKHIKGYIGPNTLIEMGLSLYLNKKIFLLNPIPNIEYKEEILGIQPIVLNNHLSKNL